LHAHNPPCFLPEPSLIPSFYLLVTFLSFETGLIPFSLREKGKGRGFKSLALLLEVESLFDKVNPVGQKELDTADQEGQSGHHSVAEGGSEPEHDEPDTNFRRNPQDTLVFAGEEEVTQGPDYAEQDEEPIDHEKGLASEKGIVYPLQCPLGLLDDLSL